MKITAKPRRSLTLAAAILCVTLALLARSGHPATQAQAGLQQAGSSSTPEPSQDSAKQVVREALPGRVPMDAEATAQQPPPPISLRLPQAFQEAYNVYDLGPVTGAQIAAADGAAALKFADVQPGPLRVGLVRSLGPVPLSIEAGSAQRIPLPDGRSVWTLAIRSPGAFGLRLHFTNVDLGDGSALVYAHGAEGVIVRGPYSGQGPQSSREFWTATLPGETAFVEVSGTDEPRLEVAEILHFDKEPAGADLGQEEAKALQALPCHLDVMCELVNPYARDAVGRMNFVEGGQGYVCTGTILNDLDDDTFVPYFLTAFHCLSTQAVVDTLEVVWLWQRDECDGTLPDMDELPRNVGGTLLETNPTDSGNDMTFIRLDGNLPGGVGLAGWTTGGLPDSFVGIHHPGGSWKRATFQHENQILDCLPTSQYHHAEQDRGVIEGGSSGSGIFSDGGQLMGQLYGICCPGSHGDDCMNSGCDNRDEYNTLYGRFDVTFPLIQRWLEMGGTIHVDRAYAGVELGTPDQPFNTVEEANNFAWDGARIKIRAGSYAETLTFSKGLTVLATGGTVTIGP